MEGGGARSASYDATRAAAAGSRERVSEAASWPVSERASE